MNTKKFTMRSGNTSTFKMMGAESPIKAMDVLLDGVSIGTGSEARAEAREIEAQNILNQKEAEKEELETGQEFVPYEDTSVAYTGDDALVMAKKSGASPKTLRSIATGVLGTEKNPYYEGMQTLSASNIGE